MQNKDVFSSIEDANNLLRESIKTARATLSQVGDVELNKDFNNLVGLFQSGADTEDIVRQILAKNENKLKDMDNVTGTR